jgi:hypothetical protein
MDLANSMDLLGIEENALSGRRLSGVNMGNNAYISCFIEWKCSCHSVHQR